MLEGLGKKITELRTSQNMNQTEFAKAVGCSKQSISGYESGAINPSYRILEAICDAFNISMNYFLTAEEKRQELINDHRRTDRLPKGIVPIDTIKPHYVPLIASVAAGRPLYMETNYDCRIEGPNKADYALTVEGDSMSPSILNGDVVYIRSQPDVEDGEIAVVIIDDSITLKHVHHLDGGLMLTSNNPAYKPMLIKFEEHEYVNILGKACGLTRMW